MLDQLLAYAQSETDAVLVLGSSFQYLAEVNKELVDELRRDAATEILNGYFEFDVQNFMIVVDVRIFDMVLESFDRLYHL